MQLLSAAFFSALTAGFCIEIIWLLLDVQHIPNDNATVTRALGSQEVFARVDADGNGFIEDPKIRQHLSTPVWTPL